MRKFSILATNKLRNKMQNSNKKEMYYEDYLNLEKILTSQNPRSFSEGNFVHDEMLFIVEHQVYELWFKQILFELDSVINLYSTSCIDDNSTSLILTSQRLNRIKVIWEVLNNQIDILDTMTAMDFYEFRDILFPASGFQSYQFKYIEAKLGVRIQDRHQYDHYKRTGQGGFNDHHNLEISRLEQEPTLSKLIDDWLKRMPFIGKEYWASDLDSEFIDIYKKQYVLSLNGSENMDKKISEFDTFFLEQIISKNQIQFPKLSVKSRQAALFIMVYRHYPLLITPYQILSILMDIDGQMTLWRNKHLLIVKKMIGFNAGTGGTSGSEYLEGASRNHNSFGELFQISSFFMHKRFLPNIPKKLLPILEFYFKNK